MRSEWRTRPMKHDGAVVYVIYRLADVAVPTHPRYGAVYIGASALPFGAPSGHAYPLGRGGAAEWTRPAACRRDEGYGACDDDGQAPEERR